MTSPPTTRRRGSPRGAAGGAATTACSNCTCRCTGDSTSCCWRRSAAAGQPAARSRASSTAWAWCCGGVEVAGLVGLDEGRRAAEGAGCRCAATTLDPDPARRRAGAASRTADRRADRRAPRRRPRSPSRRSACSSRRPRCASALGKTVLYGLVPVASAERERRRPAGARLRRTCPPTSAAAMREHFSAYLKQRPRTAMPHAGIVLDAASGDRSTAIRPKTADGRAG